MPSCTGIYETKDASLRTCKCRSFIAPNGKSCLEECDQYEQTAYDITDTILKRCVCKNVLDVMGEKCAGSCEYPHETDFQYKDPTLKWPFWRCICAEGNALDEAEGKCVSTSGCTRIQLKENFDNFYICLKHTCKDGYKRQGDKECVPDCDRWNIDMSTNEK